MARLHLFDLDGTLQRCTTASVEISRQLGLEAETVALDKAISAGLLDPPAYATHVYALWADLTDAHVSAAFDGAPWLARIREVWADIRQAGDYCAVMSLSSSFFVERLTGWGAHATFGSRFPAVPFTGPVDPAGVDLDLFGAVPVTVAVNADRHLPGLATPSYRGGDLWDGL